MSSKLKGGEVNEDASEKPMKGTRKSKRGTKVNISLCIMLYKMLFSILYVTFFIVSSKLKDGEENEYAYEKPVKVTRKSERVTKVNISLCIIVYKMFFLIIISDLQRLLLKSKLLSYLFVL